MAHCRALLLGAVLLGLICPGVRALPARKGYVSDYANVLKSATIGELETLLSEYAQRTHTPLEVLIVPTLEGESLDDYTEKIVAEWGLGKRYVLLIVALQEAAVRIATGPASRERYPDELIDPVLNETIIPAFSLGDFDRGVVEGVRGLMGLPAQRRPARPFAGLLRGPGRLLLLGAAVALAAAAFVLLRP